MKGKDYVSELMYLSLFIDSIFRTLHLKWSLDGVLSQLADEWSLLAPPGTASRTIKLLRMAGHLGQLDRLRLGLGLRLGLRFRSRLGEEISMQ